MWSAAVCRRFSGCGGGSFRPRQKGSAPPPKPPFSLTARALAASSISARPRNATFTIARDPLPADAAGASPTQEGGTCRARREAVASARARSHPQEAAGCSVPARLGDGSPRLLPAFGPRQSPPSIQALRLGREEEQDLLGHGNRGLREDCGGCRASDENRRHPSFSRRLRSCLRPVLSRLQPPPIPPANLKSPPLHNPLQ